MIHQSPHVNLHVEIFMGHVSTCICIALHKYRTLEDADSLTKSKIYHFLHACTFVVVNIGGGNLNHHDWLCSILLIKAPLI